MAASSIWSQCDGPEQIVAIELTLQRVVESQEQAATVGLVDDLDEQSLLEELLEAHKPPLPPGAERLHYLLATPFRYPPLKHGSRFGGRHEPSILYGSLKIGACLAEAAYYRFVFLEGMEERPPAARIDVELTSFEFHAESGSAVRLERPPFLKHRATLADRARYEATQALGSVMRGAGVECFTYVSARDPDAGTNAGLFTPAVLSDTAPKNRLLWDCQMRADRVSFRQRIPAAPVYHFDRELFTVTGRLPTPAL